MALKLKSKLILASNCSSVIKYELYIILTFIMLAQDSFCVILPGQIKKQGVFKSD